MRFSFLIVFFFLNLNAIGQNLVPNPSFEDLDFCPFQINQIQAATGWMNWRGTPELYNSCSSGSLNMPNAGFGFQYAHTGASMGGLISFSNPNGSAGPNIREFIAIQLITPLIVGTKYYISFFVNLADFAGYYYATNNIGVQFSTNVYSANTPIPINNFSHFKNDSLINDTTNWAVCTGSFIADSTYSFISLGNFYNDSLTLITTNSLQPNTAYYYFDDICVSSDSLFNATWTSIPSVFDNSIVNLYPNPVQGILNINCNLKIEKLIVINSIGQAVLTISNVKHKEIDLTQFQNGIYKIHIQFQNSQYIETIVIQH